MEHHGDLVEIEEHSDMKLQSNDQQIYQMTIAPNSNAYGTGEIWDLNRAAEMLRATHDIEGSSTLSHFPVQSVDDDDVEIFAGSIIYRNFFNSFEDDFDDFDI